LFKSSYLVKYTPKKWQTKS